MHTRGRDPIAMRRKKAGGVKKGGRGEGGIQLTAIAMRK